MSYHYLTPGCGCCNCGLSFTFACLLSLSERRWIKGSGRMDSRTAAFFKHIYKVIAIKVNRFCVPTVLVPYSSFMGQLTQKRLSESFSLSSWLRSCKQLLLAQGSSERYQIPKEMPPTPSKTEQLV